LQGGEATDAFFVWCDANGRAVNDLLNYISNKGDDAFQFSFDGDGNPVYWINPPTGNASMQIAAFALSQAQSDDDLGVTYLAVAETRIDVGGSAVTNIPGYVGASVSALGAAVQTPVGLACAGLVKKCFQAVANRITNALGPGADLPEIELQATGDAASTTNTVTDEAATVAADVSFDFASAIGFAAIVLGAIPIIVTFLEKNVYHRLKLINFTDIRLGLQDPFCIKGVTITKPSPAKLFGVRKDTNAKEVQVSTGEYFMGNTNPFDGVTYVIRIPPDPTNTDPDLANGLVGIVQVPYDTSKRTIYLSFTDVAATDWTSWTDNDWSNYYNSHQPADGGKTFSATSKSGKYTATLTISDNSDENGALNSVLTIVDKRYGDYPLDASMSL
jgi:hypothetical protein